MKKNRMRQIAGFELHLIWNTEDFDEKLKLVEELLGTLRFKAKVNKLIESAREARSAQTLDFLVANVFHCGEGNKTIKLY